MKKYKKDTLLEATPEQVQKEIELIYSIKEISENPSENQSLNNIADYTAYSSSTAKKRIKEDLEDKNLVEIQPSNNEGHGKKVELTSKGEELHNALKPLDYNIKSIEDGVNQLRKKIRRNPTENEIIEDLGLKLDIETISKVEGWGEPSETVKKEARKELQEILEHCLIPIHYDLDVEKMQKAEEKELNQAAEYYIENKEVMDDFKQISDSREYRCPVELEKFVESRKMKAPPKPLSLYQDGKNREDLDSWAHSFTEEVFEYWQNNHPEHDKGVKTFHSPVKKNPEFLILSYNPGWTEGDGEEDLEKYQNKDFSPPEKHEFIEREYPMAKAAKKLFKNNLDTLENSVMHDLIFFRSNDVSELKQKMRDNDGFEDLKSFSIDKVKNSIETLKPEKILLLGIGTFDLFDKEIDEIQVEREVKRSEIEDEEISKYSDRRVFIEGKLDETKIYAIAHISNARGFSDKEMEFDRDNIFG